MSLPFARVWNVEKWEDGFGNFGWRFSPGGVRFEILNFGSQICLRKGGFHLFRTGSDLVF